ncbi:MAG: HEAT repeat domain-containing protein [Woeseiaceae bacterium]|nr:HEAT repeat domain-containing protein [Woeseiaceae bacterium]
MKTLAKLILVATALLLATATLAQSPVGEVSNVRDDSEALKIAAVEALITAPPDKALPVITKVLAANHSNEIKETALFILSQIDRPEAQSLLLKFAREQSGELQLEAIRMIGIGGDSEALTNLKSIYDAGNSDAREAVLEAYMIAGNKKAVFDIAVSAKGDDFETAVHLLGAMGAHEELRALRSQTGPSETLIQAYAVSGDLDELRQLAMDGGDPDLQAQAIEAMGIVGGDEVDTDLVQIYRDAKSDGIREAALHGLMISGHDAGVLELYRASTSSAEKKELLELLIIMGSDDVWSIIDSALDGDQ